MSDFKQTMKWLSRVTKDNFNNVVNDNISITFDKGFKILSMLFMNLYATLKEKTNRQNSTKFQ